MSKLNELSKTARTIIIGLSLSAVALGSLIGFKKFSVSVEDDKAKSSIQVADVKNANVAIVNGTGASVNFYQSADYKALQAQLEKAQQRVKNYPDDAEFRAELKQAAQNLEDFKRDVVKLAEDFNKIPIKTERLRLAKEKFEQGDYQAARTILDTEAITQGQSALLNKQQNLQQQQAELSQQLQNNANEYILKAKLTAIDYSLGEQRIAKTRELFELALKSTRIADNIFAYAKFLQDNNQFADAERYYQEVLSISRELAKNNAAVYLPDVATTLNNLAVLVANDSGRYKEAETLYQEALSIRRELAKNNVAVYLPDIAMTLNNLASLVKADSGRRKEAETLYSETLSISRELAKNNVAVYLPDVAGTLNNLALLVDDDSGRRKEAETLYQEALSIYRELAKDNVAVYLPDIAMTLDNLASLVKADSGRRKEAETLYSEALSIRRELAKVNAAVYLPNVATTLNNLAVLIDDDSGRYKEAENLYQEALRIRRELAKDNAAVYLPYVASTLNNLALLVKDDSDRRKEAENLYQEALSIHRELAKDNAAVYLPYLANTLTAFGWAYLNWQEPKQALIYLQEAADILAPFAQQAPEVFAEKQALILQLIEQAKQQQAKP